MALEDALRKRGLVSDKAMDEAKTKKVADLKYQNFGTQDAAKKFLDAHKAGGGYGYISSGGSDANGWEVRHWTD